jgi:hypothetical protein
MVNAYAGPDTEISPNADHIRAFITWWFEHCTAGKIEIGWLDQDGSGLRHFVQFDKSQLNELVNTAVQANLVPGQSCYVRAATVADRAGTIGFTTDKDFVQAPGIWSDIDTQEDLDRAKSVQSIVRPLASVITGRIPHMRVQNWFKCNAPIVNADLVASLNRRICALYSGDSSVVNPSRLMRLPGTLAWPWKKDRTNVELTALVMPGPGDTRPISYPLTTFTSQLPQEDAQAKPATSEQTTGFHATLDSTSELIRLIRTGQEWHKNMVRLTGRWVARGWSNGEILTAAESFTLPGFTVSETLKEVFTAVEGGRKKWSVPDQEDFVGPEPIGPFPAHVIDPWDTLQPPAFPIHALPGVLRDYTESRARIMGADTCALAWAAISACSAAIDGRTRLRMKRHDTWSVPPTIWVALIGRSSAKKSPIIADAWRPLDLLQGVAMRRYTDLVKQHNALEKEEKKETPPPVKPIRLLSHDATMEGLQDILSHQERGIGILRDELSGWIGGMDKYGGNGAAERAFWLQAHNGGSHVVDRVGRGTVAISNLLAAICGGIQPERLAQFSNLTDDGMWQRFVPIIMQNGCIGTDEPPGDAAERYSERLQDLVESSRTQSIIALSDDAHEIRLQLEREVFELEAAEPLGSRFATFTGKLPGLFGRLALVLSRLEPTGLGMTVSERHASMARTLIMQCIIPHAARVYMTMEAQASGNDSLTSIAGYILAKKLSRVVMSDLTSNVRACRKAPQFDVQRMVSPLVSGGWLEPETDLPNNRGWKVNPIIHTKFAARAEREIVRRKAAREMIEREEGE